MKTTDFTDQVAVITGAASGIGRALAFRAMTEGMQVVAADISAGALEDLKADANRQGFEIETYKLNVADASEMQTFSAQVFREHGSVGLLFNNAGVMTIGRTWETSISDWRRCIDVNVLGVVNGIHSFVPPMLTQGSPGRVLNTASIGGLIGGGPFMGPYQGTKHMVVALTESLERELRSEAAPVSVSLICPAAVATAIDPSVSDADAEKKSLGAKESVFREKFTELVSGGVDAKELAAEVFEAIREERFWIIPKTVSNNRLRSRYDDSVSGR